MSSTLLDVTGRPAALDAARTLVAERFPAALGAWLGGSAGTARETATSDLDVTVLLAEAPETVVRRESVEHAGWPVELFVHTEASVRHYVAKDLARRRPTMTRLVAEGVVLVGGPAAERLVAHCRAVLDAGPPALGSAERDAARYALSDLLDDLAGGGPPGEVAAIAVETWRSTAELLLDLGGRWRGSGKWLARELEAHDPERTGRLLAGLRAALAGDPAPLTAAADEVLALAGGRLWVGYGASGEEGSR